MVQIVIVAGGLATRMKPLTEEIPKCLIDIHGMPLIEHQLRFFKKNGYKNIIFCIAHLAEKVKEHFKDGSPLGLNILYAQESGELRGTAGSVRLAERLIGDDEDFIVYYGDNLTSMDFDSFLRFHREKGGIATICLRPLPEGYKSSSVIILDSNGKIRVFLEKPPLEEIEKYEGEIKYINSGIYAFKKEVFGLIPKDEKYDFAKHLFPKLMRLGRGIYGYPTEEFFREIGRVEKYEQFIEEFKGKTLLL